MNQMFDKIQMILMMKTSIANNRISQLNDIENGKSLKCFERRALCFSSYQNCKLKVKLR